LIEIQTGISIKISFIRRRFILSKTLVLPIACDLDRSQGGRIIVGRETAEACDKAREYVRERLSGGSFDYVVTPAAGKPKNSQWNGVVMSEIMKSYLVNQGMSSDHVIALTGKTFDTRGEAKAVVEYLEQHPEIHLVVVCVKWWHAHRCWIMLDNYLRLSSVITWPVRIHVETCYSSHISNSVIRHEFWRAAPWNKIKILMSQILIFPRWWAEWKRRCQERCSAGDFPEE